MVQHFSFCVNPTLGLLSGLACGDPAGDLAETIGGVQLSRLAVVTRMQLGTAGWRTWCGRAVVALV